ncbi:hypothetical protein Droror1_Dr00015387 [Drosera rotundifolia]
MHESLPPAPALPNAISSSVNQESSSSTESTSSAEPGSSSPAKHDDPSTANPVSSKDLPSNSPNTPDLPPSSPDIPPSWQHQEQLIVYHRRQPIISLNSPSISSESHDPPQNPSSTSPSTSIPLAPWKLVGALFAGLPVRDLLVIALLSSEDHYVRVLICAVLGVCGGWRYYTQYRSELADAALSSLCEFLTELCPPPHTSLSRLTSTPHRASISRHRGRFLFSSRCASRPPPERLSHCELVRHGDLGDKEVGDSTGSCDSTGVARCGFWKGSGATGEHARMAAAALGVLRGCGGTGTEASWWRGC